PIELLSKGKTTTTGRAEPWAAAGLVIAAAANAVAAAAERTTWISGRMMFLLNLHVGRAGGAARSRPRQTVTVIPSAAGVTRSRLPRAATMAWQAATARSTSSSE